MTYDTISDDKTIVGNGEGTLLAGRYRVVRQLGQGGMGSVWLAEDTQLDNKLFAIKMLPSILVSNKRAYRQLKDEALVAMKLTHPNIVTLRDFNENDGNPFLVMDYIDGQTLDDYLAEHSPADATPADVARPPRPCCKGEGALATSPGATGAPRPPQCGIPEADVLRILRPIAAALDYAHAKGVVHRDVKPGNVMIAKDGTPYILDFGIAREIQETLTRVTGKISSGTLLYMSPEQLHGASPKPAQDIYSFAAMAYECLKGEPPFVRGQIEYQIDNDSPEPLPGGPRSCAAAVMAGLAKKPEDRPTTCADVLLVPEPPVVPRVEPLPPRQQEAEAVGHETCKGTSAQRFIPRSDWRYLPPDMRPSEKGSIFIPSEPKPKPIPSEDWRYLPPEMRSSLGGNGQGGQKRDVAPNVSLSEGSRLSQPTDPQPGRVASPRRPPNPLPGRAVAPRPPQSGLWKILLAIITLALVAVCGVWYYLGEPADAEEKAVRQPAEVKESLKVATKFRNKAIELTNEVEKITNEEVFKEENKVLSAEFMNAERLFVEACWPKSAQEFSNYVVHAEILLKNHGEWKYADAARAKADKAKNNAKNEGAERYATNSWAKAETLMSSAYLALSLKQFAQASSNFVSVAELFNKCVNEAKRERERQETVAKEKESAVKNYSTAKRWHSWILDNISDGSEPFKTRKDGLEEYFKKADELFEKELWAESAQSFSTYVKRAEILCKDYGEWKIAVANGSGVNKPKSGTGNPQRPRRLYKYEARIVPYVIENGQKRFVKVTIEDKNLGMDIRLEEMEGKYHVVIGSDKVPEFFPRLNLTYGRHSAKEWISASLFNSSPKEIELK